MHLQQIILICAALTLAVPGFAQDPGVLQEVRTMRLAGQLEEALQLAADAAAATDDHDLGFELYLELARIHDRTGLHRNTRPVAESLANIELAAEIAAANPDNTKMSAEIELARADYHYRAEMTERQFPVAESHASNAIAMFAELGDHHGQAEAVHHLGLIEMQRGNLESARALFEESLEHDIAGGERVFFRGEYERHVGFVILLQGDREAAVPYFERSLAARREAGAIDASLFAAGTLASSLVELDRLDEARLVLLYAMNTGESVDTPVGRARVGLTLARLRVKEGDLPGARSAYALTIDFADSVDYSSVADTARRELDGI